MPSAASTLLALLVMAAAAGPLATGLSTRSLADVLPSTRSEFLSWICPAGTEQCDEGNLPKSSSTLLSRLIRELSPALPKGAEAERLKRKQEASAESNLPYWRFVPQYIGTIRQGQALPTFSTTCYGEVNVDVEPGLVGGMYVRVNVRLRNQTVQPLCMERFWFSLGALSEKDIYQFSDDYKVFFNTSGFTEFQQWDLATKGIRVYVFNDTEWQQMTDLLDTALLFAPMLSGNVDPVSMADNMQYLNQYSQIKPFTVDRPNSSALALDESLINNGDMLFQSDMTGLGPTIAFPTGSTANHVAIFLRDPLFGDLNVCESQTDGVICTEYQTWLDKQVKRKAATVFVPLSPELSKSFNNAVAWDWVWSQVGLAYGYNTFFFGWIDTKQDNYPCFPPDFKRCLKWEHVEWFLLNLQGLSADLTMTFVGQAFNHRTNTSNLTLPELFMYAEKTLNLSAGDIIAVPEQDSWTYQTSKDDFPYTGKSMVCSVFACHVLRQGGVFSSIGGDLECSEQTPFDIASMEIYDEGKMGANRPQVCVERDPDNHVCQLSGPFTFHLNDGRNTRVPYRQMSNYCTSQNPEYNRTSNC